MSRKSGNHEERMREILDVAKALFLEQGYAQTTVDSIVRTMSVAKGMVYYYFHSKDEILDAVLQREIQELAGEVRVRCFDIEGSAIDKLDAFLDYLSTLLARQDLLFARLQPNECAHLYAEANVVCVQVLLPMVVEVIRQGIAEGLVNVGAPDVTALILINGTFALALHRELAPQVTQDLAALSAAGRDFYARILGFAPA